MRGCLWTAAIIVFGLFVLGLALQRYQPPGSAQPPPRELSTPAQRAAAQDLINDLGYDCREVDIMLPFAFSEGWTVWCNHMRYQFELANHGGKWSVEAKPARRF